MLTWQIKQVFQKQILGLGVDWIAVIEAFYYKILLPFFYVVGYIKYTFIAITDLLLVTYLTYSS